MVGQDRVEVARRRSVGEPVAPQQSRHRYAAFRAVSHQGERGGTKAGGVGRIGSGLQHFGEAADSRFVAGPPDFPGLRAADEIGHPLADVGHDRTREFGGMFVEFDGGRS